MNQPFDSGTDAAWLRGVIGAARRSASELSAALTEGEPPARAIPGYQILREIHRGAQGVVYQAIQRATQRKVAIKILSSGEFASPRAKARFRREIRVLGQFRHPNIVSVHDSGSADGNFFYVMDYISGNTLDAYMAERRPDLIESLRLFAKMCDAVNAAHLRGIIHRDLKPGNILVDREGEPHIVDFGLAKASLENFAGEDEGTQVVVSRTGEFTGSLPWASPEQALGNSSKIDIRTDVYSLGVILFQMLTRTFPYPVAGNLRDVLDNILHAEPTRPRSLRRDIDSDVETIILKALTKGADRRYQSAGELARDVYAYLGGEPLSAKRDSTLYVLSKKIRRHRAPIALTSVFATMLIVFVGTLSLMRQKAAAAERRASEIQLSAVDLALEAFDPGTGRLKKIERLPRLMEQIDDELSNYPVVQARLYEKIGNVLKRLGGYEQAGLAIQRSLDIRRARFPQAHEEVASSLHNLAAVRWFNAEFAEAEELYRQALEIRRTVFDNNNLAVAESLHHLGTTLRSLGRTDEAAELYDEALSIRTRLLGEDDPEVAASTNELAILLMDLGQYAEAEPLFRRALASVSKADPLEMMGAERPQYIARAQTSLAAVLVELGLVEEAEGLLAESLSRKRELLGSTHPDVASTLHWVAKLRLLEGDLPGAESNAAEALRLRKAAWPGGHPLVASTASLLGEILLEDGRPAEAEPLLTAALDLQRTRQPVGHWQTGHTLSLLGTCFALLGRSLDAEPLLIESVEVLSEARGRSDPYTQAAAERIIHYYRQIDRRETAAAYEARFGAEQP